MVEDVRVEAEVEVPIIGDAQGRMITTLNTTTEGLNTTTEGLTGADDRRETMTSTKVREEDTPQIDGITPDPDQLARGHLAMRGSIRKDTQILEKLRANRRT